MATQVAKQEGNTKICKITKLKPLGNRVLVRRLEAEEKLQRGNYSSRHSKEETGTSRGDRNRDRQER